MSLYAYIQKLSKFLGISLILCLAIYVSFPGILLGIIIVPCFYVVGLFLEETHND